MRRFSALLSVVVIMLLGIVASAGQPIAVAQEATPAAAGVLATTMYGITIPVDALPSWDRVTISPTHFTIPAGTESTWDAHSGACCPGPRLKFIVASALTVIPDGTLEVLRAGHAT